MASSVVLNTGAKMPTVGLGLWKSKPGEVKQAVLSALKQGYRLLDGAAAYQNEAEVGDAITEAIETGVVKREELFVVSKLFNTAHVWKGDATRVAAACDQTLKDLKLDYLDLYLMHWPFAFEQTELQSIGGLRLPDGTPNPKLVFEIEFMETWAEMVKLYKAGKVKAIGVSNFTEKQLGELLAGSSGVVPAINQVELHPYLQQPDLRAFCAEKGIQVMAYSGLGSGDSYSGTSFPLAGDGPFQCASGGATLLKNAVVNEIAAKLAKSPAQILIRWSVQSGAICIPKTVKPERIAENHDVYGWEIPADDMAALSALNCGFRYGIGYCPGHFDCPNAPWGADGASQ
eukprot:m.89202 g.89202  ORF g.89202 m.89202 type:complete len:344 (+) comp11712_c0_seq2:52-1083(+)